MRKGFKEPFHHFDNKCNIKKLLKIHLDDWITFFKIDVFVDFGKHIKKWEYPIIISHFCCSKKIKFDYSWMNSVYLRKQKMHFTKRGLKRAFKAKIACEATKTSFRKLPFKSHTKWGCLPNMSFSTFERRAFDI